MAISRSRMEIVAFPMKSYMCKQIFACQRGHRKTTARLLSKLFFNFHCHARPSCLLERKKSGFSWEDRDRRVHEGGEGHKRNIGLVKVGSLHKSSMKPQIESVVKPIVNPSQSPTPMPMQPVGHKKIPNFSMFLPLSLPLHCFVVFPPVPSRGEKILPKFIVVAVEGSRLKTLTQQTLSH